MPRRRRIPRVLKDYAIKCHQEGVTTMDIRARLAVLGCCVSLSRIARWFSHAQQNAVRDSDVNEGELENVEEPPTQPAASATAAAAATAAAPPPPPPPPPPSLFPPTVLTLDEGGFLSYGFNSQNLISDIGLFSDTDDTDYSDMPELEASHEDDSMPPLIDELSENIDRVDKVLNIYT